MRVHPVFPITHNKHHGFQNSKKQSNNNQGFQKELDKAIKSLKERSDKVES